MTLTVGYVSGIIAAAIHVVQFLLPDAIALILANITRDEQSAITWSVVGQALQNSHWPAILRSEASSAGDGIRKSVRVVTFIRPFGWFLVTISAVVTPLGLYQAIAPNSNPEAVAFYYVRDSSPFGRGTPKRSSLGFSHSCYLGSEECTDVPENTTLLFQSGLLNQPSTVSSMFDIQWRSYTTANIGNDKNRPRYLLGTFRQLMSLTLNNAIESVEGLIVDTQNGGIGFRNHTVPIGLEHGGTWSEDLLFIEPETQCVDTNLSLAFYIPEDPSDKYGLSKTLSLVDRRGFINLNHDYPYYNKSDPQQDADLRGRAYVAAWLHNFYTALYMNVTRPNPDNFAYLNSFVGKHFPVVSSSDSTGYNLLQISSSFTDYNVIPVLTTNGSLELVPTYEDICQSTRADDFANVSNIAVGCGLMQGAAEPLNGDSPVIFDGGSNWSIPLYTCASANKALIKKVDFRYNGTDGLKGLSVARATAKTYGRVTDKPLWVVENNQTELGISGPLWGLAVGDLERHDGYVYVQREHLYLPGLVGERPMPDVSYQNTPGVDFNHYALASTYSVGSSQLYKTQQDYSGASDFAMFALWQELSKAPATAARILNLIWTDVAANAVVGTRSWLTHKPVSNQDIGSITSNDRQLIKKDIKSPTRRETSAGIAPDDSSADVPITVFYSRVHYRWYFAIPALLTALVSGILLAYALILLIFGRAKRLHQYIFRLSAGRLLGNFLYPDECHPMAPTKVWRRNVGVKRVKLGVDVPEARDHVMFEKLGQVTVAHASVPDSETMS